MSKYGQPNNYQRKPSQPSNYQRKPNNYQKEEPVPASEVPQQETKVAKYNSPDESVYPPLNIKMAVDSNSGKSELDYVTTVYPFFKSNDSDIVGYRTSKNSEVNFFVDNALIVKEKQADGKFKIVSIITPKKNKLGNIQWVPEPNSDSRPYFAFIMKSKDEK